MAIWSGEPSGEYSVRSVYKLLQNGTSNTTLNPIQPETKLFYKNLWNQSLPGKIKIYMWRLSHNFVTTMSNLFLKRMVVNTMCPRCRTEAETIWHLGWMCPLSKEVWRWFREGRLTSLFNNSSKTQQRIASCTIWALWYERNKKEHGSVCKSGKEVADFVLQYIWEIDAIEIKKSTCVLVSRKWEHPPTEWVKGNFDAAFSQFSSTAGLGVLIRDSHGQVLVSKSTVHMAVPNVFTAEALVAVKGIKLGLDLVLQKIVIEGDYQLKRNATQIPQIYL